MSLVIIFVNFILIYVKYACLYENYVLHLQKQNSINMKTKNLLLPHYFQKIGWGLFIFSFIFLVGAMYTFNTLKLFSQNNSHYATLTLYIILLLSALFVAFSKEKIEDELIQRIRYKSIVITAYIGFLLFIIILIMYAFNQSFDFLPRPVFTYLRFMNPLTMFMFYVLIFRVSLFISKNGIKNEE